MQNDTWMWDGQTWSEINTGAAPPPRVGHAMAYDSSRHALVLFGGTDGHDNSLIDTWEFTCIPVCYPDLGGNGVLDLFDFLAFVNSFNTGDTGPADCDHSGVLDLFDFLCYTNAFNKGC